MPDWTDLDQRLAAATGADYDLDGAVARAFGCPPAHYSGEADQCRALVASALPGWKLHVGFDVAGVFPYAALTRGDLHIEAEAPSLPIAILRVAVKAARSSS